MGKLIILLSPQDNITLTRNNNSCTWINNVKNAIMWKWKETKYKPIYPHIVIIEESILDGTDISKEMLFLVSSHYYLFENLECNNCNCVADVAIIEQNKISFFVLRSKAPKSHFYLLLVFHEWTSLSKAKAGNWFKTQGTLLLATIGVQIAKALSISPSAMLFKPLLNFNGLLS